MLRTVVHFTDATSFGGAERILLTILAGLDRQRWRPVLVHHDLPGVAPLIHEARTLDIKTLVVPPSGLCRVTPWLVDRVRELRAERTDVFHAHLTWARRCRGGLAAAIIARVPAIIATQQLFNGIRSESARWAQRLLFLGVHRYVAVSRAMSRALAPMCVRASRKIRVIHNGVPIAAFGRPASATVRASLTDGIDRPVVVTLARLDPQKGLEYLIDAAALVPDALFAIAGEGSERAALEQRAQRVGVAKRVRFLGHRADVPDLLASADLFVLPSLFEGLPVSVLEAMAAGKAVIATALDGTDEAVLHGETGLLVPPRDPAALAAAVRTLLDDPARRERLAAAGAARVRQEFSADVMVERIVATYEELLAPNGRSHALA